MKTLVAFVQRTAQQAARGGITVGRAALTLGRTTIKFVVKVVVQP